MSMSNLAVRMELSANELLSDLAKPELRVVTNPAPAERDNRLRLLQQVRAATAKVADFSKIAG